ncbi:MAG TPA: glycosyltransferase family 4 protein [Gemmatimonadales bacterium]|nr:glycosyltransferase family 4 protein [Gemmatimonadales bacterium]
MRILHVLTAFPRTRDDVIVPWLVALLKRLQAEGHDVEVFTSAYKGGGNESFDGIPVHRFRYFFAGREDLTHDEATPDRMRRSLLYKILPLFYVVGGLIGIRRLVRRRQYDVIHVHWPVPHALFGWMAKRASKERPRLVTTWYGVELRWVQSSLPWLRWFVRWALKISDTIVAISSYTAREIARFAQVPVEVIPYTLPFAAGTSQARLPRAGGFQVLFVGRLVERKGVKHLIEAIARMPDARLVVIGDGPERQALEAGTRDLGLGSRVDFRGRVSDDELRATYAASDALVLPSILDARGDTEGLGVVLLEAMSYGVPVVASDIGGITDIVEHNQSGLLVPPGDSAALAQALERLSRDAALAQRLGAAGEQRVRSAFGWTEIMAKWDAVYRARAQTRTDTASAAESGATPPRAPAR